MPTEPRRGLVPLGHRPRRVPCLLGIGSRRSVYLATSAAPGAAPCLAEIETGIGGTLWGGAGTASGGILESTDKPQLRYISPLVCVENGARQGECSLVCLCHSVCLEPL